MKSVKEVPINSLLPDLSIRTANCLAKAHIYTLSDLLNSDIANLESLQGFGRGCAKDLAEQLNTLAEKKEFNVSNCDVVSNDANAHLEVPIKKALPFLSVRTMNCLTSRRIRSLRELICSTPEDLMNIPNFGKTCLGEIIQNLKALSLSLQTSSLAQEQSAKLMLTQDEKTSIGNYRTLLLSRFDKSGALHEPDSEKEDKSLLEQVTSLVLSSGDAWRVAKALKVSPSTVDKLIRNQKVSPITLSKVRQGITSLKQVPDLQYKAISDSRRQKLMGIYEMYQKEQTLEGTAKHFNVSRERIRQLLEEGARLRLFEYIPLRARDKNLIPAEIIVKDYKRYGSLKEIAKAHNTSLMRLTRILRRHGLTQRELKFALHETKREICAEQFKALAKELGRFPTVTDLQMTSTGHQLYTKICRYWGSIDSLRQELNVPRPKHGNPRFREIMQKQKQIWAIVRMDHLDRIRQLLSGQSPLSLRDIGAKVGLREGRLYKLIGMLIANNEVERIGSGPYSQYRLRRETI